MDLIAVKAMCNRKVWEHLRGTIPTDTLSGDTYRLLGWVDAYWDAYPSGEVLEVERFRTLLATRAKTLTSDVTSLLMSIMQRVQDVPEQDVQDTIALFTETACAGELQALLARYNEGAEIDLASEMRAIQSKYTILTNTQDELYQWENRDPLEILQDNDETTGLRLNFCGLGETLVPIKGGDNYAVCAPVDAGKTSFIAKMVDDFATQMHGNEVYDDRCILWLVNEGVASRCLPRLYSAALNKTLAELKTMAEAGTLVPALKARWGDNYQERIRVKNAHGMTISQVYTLVEQWKPHIIITDMTANIRGGKAENSETQNQEFIWQSFREIGAEFDAAHIGTLQLSADGYDNLFPALTHIKQSKVGVQGALDVCIMLGRMDPNTYPDRATERGISTPKNKRARTGCNGLNQMQVVFDAPRCQFITGQDTTVVPTVQEIQNAG